MNVWDKIKSWGRGLMQRTATATGIAREFKDIFELGDVPAFNQFYYYGIFVWKALYRGLYKDWHVVPVISVGAKPGQTRQLFRLNTAKAVSALLCVITEHTARTAWFGDFSDCRRAPREYPARRSCRRP